MNGTITGIENHGTIVLVTVWTEETNLKIQVPFDHSPFRWMVEGRGGIENIINQPVMLTESDGMDVLSFEDEN